MTANYACGTPRQHSLRFKSRSSSHLYEYLFLHFVSWHAHRLSGSAQRISGHLSRTCDYYTCTVPVLEQLTLARFIDEGDFGRHINRSRTAGRHRRTRLLQLIRRSPLIDLASIDEKDAGLHFLLRLHGNFTADDRENLRQASRQKGIAINFLDDYRRPKDRLLHYSNDCPLTIVINYSNLEPDLYEPTSTISPKPSAK